MRYYLVRQIIMNYTINEIAEMAHVAKSTVSKALNGQKGVCDEKRKEILKLAGKMNYRPNASARALAQHRSETIGLIIPADVGYSLSGIYWAEIIAAVAEEVNKRNYNLLLIIPSKENPTKTIENIILKKSIDGVIVPAEQLTAEELRMFTEFNIPFVLQGRTPLCKHYCVDVRNTEGAEMLTGELIKKGYRHIGCITGPESFQYTQERLEGFKNVLRRENIEYAPVKSTLYSLEETRKTVIDFVRNNPELDALFISAGGEFVFYIIDILKEERKDLSKFGIAVFDDYRPFHYMPFNIISAKQPIKQMGTQDAKILFQLIEREEPPTMSLFDISLS